MFLLGIKHLCRPFFSSISKTIVNLLSYFRTFKQIFEHINCPLSGLILEPRKPRSVDYQGVLLVSAFVHCECLLVVNHLVWECSLGIDVDLGVGVVNSHASIAGS